MYNNYISLFEEIHKSISQNEIEKAEYLILHYLENEPKNGKIILFEYLRNIKKEKEISKKILFKLILKYKRDIQLRLRYITLLLDNQEYTNAIKWCERTLQIASKHEKKEIYFYLAKIFYELYRPERAIQYINLCLKIDGRFQPAKHLQNLIIKNIHYESH